MFRLFVQKLRQPIERGMKRRRIKENTRNLRNLVTGVCSR